MKTSKFENLKIKNTFGPTCANQKRPNIYLSIKTYTARLLNYIFRMANYTMVILILVSSTLHNTNCSSRHQILNAVDGKFIKYRYLPLYNSFRDIRSNLFHKNYGQESLESYSTLYLTTRKRTCTHISPIICISCDKFEITLISALQ